MKTILVVEDNFDIRENACEMLELAGYTTLQATNGEEGVLIAQIELPDLIICDIMMPKLDGYDVLNILSSDPATKNIPFVFLTAKTETIDFKKGLSIGADDYIAKPFSEKDLLNTVRLRLQKVEDLKEKIYQLRKEDVANSAIKITRDLNELLQIVQYEVKAFKKKEYIYLKGYRAYSMFYIKKGFVKTYLLHEGGKEFITNIYQKGEYFGHHTLIKDNMHEDYAVALEDTELIYIPRSEFTQLIYNNIEIAKWLIEELSNEVIEKEKQLLNMAYDPLKQKVIKTLCKLYLKYKDQNSKEARITLTREEVAKYMGTTRESFIRVMGILKDEGVIDISEGDIIIKNLKKLEVLL